jgi:biotin transport system substrate-specific component
MRETHALACYEPVNNRITAATEILAVAGAVALGALIKVRLPFSPVPITLQTFPVLLAGFAVGRWRASAGILLYVLLGLAQAPVFAVSTGPTLGYLLAFIATPWIVMRFENRAFGILAASVAIYALGAGWLCLAYRFTPWQALIAGVAPFLAGDAVKAAAAWQLAERVRRP